jgi:hypothetical protein
MKRSSKRQTSVRIIPSEVGPILIPLKEVKSLSDKGIADIAFQHTVQTVKFCILHAGFPPAVAEEYIVASLQER